MSERLKSGGESVSNPEAVSGMKVLEKEAGNFDPEKALKLREQDKKKIEKEPKQKKAEHLMVMPEKEKKELNPREAAEEYLSLLDELSKDFTNPYYNEERKGSHHYAGGITRELGKKYSENPHYRWRGYAGTEAGVTDGTMLRIASADSILANEISWREGGEKTKERVAELDDEIANLKDEHGKKGKVGKLFGKRKYEKALNELKTSKGNIERGAFTIGANQKIAQELAISYNENGTYMGSSREVEQKNEERNRRFFGLDDPERAKKVERAIELRRKYKEQWEEDKEFGLDKTNKKEMRQEAVTDDEVERNFGKDVGPSAISDKKNVEQTNQGKEKEEQIEGKKEEKKQFLPERLEGMKKKVEEVEKIDNILSVNLLSGNTCDNYGLTTLSSKYGLNEMIAVIDKAQDKIWGLKGADEKNMSDIITEIYGVLEPDGQKRYELYNSMIMPENTLSNQRMHLEAALGMDENGKIIVRKGGANGVALYDRISGIGALNKIINDENSEIFGGTVKEAREKGCTVADVLTEGIEKQSMNDYFNAIKKKVFEVSKKAIGQLGEEKKEIDDNLEKIRKQIGEELGRRLEPLVKISGDFAKQIEGVEDGDIKKLLEAQLEQQREMIKKKENEANQEFGKTKKEYLAGLGVSDRYGEYFENKVKDLGKIDGPSLDDLGWKPLI